VCNVSLVVHSKEVFALIIFNFSKGKLDMSYRDDPGRVDPPEDVSNPYDIDQDEVCFEKICDTLADPLVLWEGMSIDGFTEPYPRATSFFYIRQNAIRQSDVEEALLYAFASKNYESIGEIVFDQLEGYAKRIIEHRS
tara:strand:+ start:985 stop:1398 length:414 start_codon:yes stop_codon:yes gene_type:complete